MQSGQFTGRLAIMIRKVLADRWVLFRQDDHAKLSADLGSHVGNTRFASPDPSVLRAIAHHDAGWPMHDDQPTLNPRGEPLDVFETPRDIALKVWSASAERAATIDPYAGLLVSMHGLALSAYAVSLDLARSEQQPPHLRFAMNQFQHAQIELQEALRKQLGFRTDRPLKLGLAEDSLDPREQKLAFDFRLLQAMDQLSLNLCCTTPPAPVMKLHPQPGLPLREVIFRRMDAHRATVSPWLFQDTLVEVSIPAVEMSAQVFSDTEAFRQAYAEATDRHRHVHHFTLTSLT